MLKRRRLVGGFKRSGRKVKVTPLLLAHSKSIAGLNASSAITVHNGTSGVDWQWWILYSSARSSSKHRYTQLIILFLLLVLINSLVSPCWSTVIYLYYLLVNLQATNALSQLCTKFLILRLLQLLLNSFLSLLVSNGVPIFKLERILPVLTWSE